MREILFAVTLLLFSVQVALATHPDNLEEALPTELEDAFPTPLGSREVQAVFTYIDEGREHQVIYRPIFEMGILPRTQLDLSATFYSGNADRTGSGNVSAEVLYNFNDETTVIPATALVVEADFPTGRDSSGVDLTTKLVLSKKVLPQAASPHRAHVNLAWTRNAGRNREEERRDLYTWILGLSMTATEHTTLILDFVREQKEERHQEANLAELGVRHEIVHAAMVTAGAGVGLGGDSEDYRLTLSLQYEF